MTFWNWLDGEELKKKGIDLLKNYPVKRVGDLDIGYIYPIIDFHGEETRWGHSRSLLVSTKGSLIRTMIYNKAHVDCLTEKVREGLLKVNLTLKYLGNDKNKELYNIEIFMPAIYGPLAPAPAPQKRKIAQTSKPAAKGSPESQPIYSTPTRNNVNRPALEMLAETRRKIKFFLTARDRINEPGVATATTPPTVFVSEGKFRADIADEVQLTLLKVNDAVLTGRHGSSVYKTDGRFKRCVFGDNENNLCLQWGEYIINVTLADDNCVQVDTSQPASDGDLFACFPFGDDQWYGGPERWYQDWPVQTTNIDNKPFLTGYDSSQSVAEPFWFTSKGASIHVDPEVPLYVDSNQRTKGELCLIARVADQYQSRDKTQLKYEMCSASNAVESQKLAVRRYFGKPMSRPNPAMFRDPIYSTWVRYGRDINQEKMKNLVDEIRSNNFPVGQIEIDDTWEPCYGAFEFDTNRFPNIKEFTDYVHSFGGRVTAWIYPFINKGCNPNYDDAAAAGRFIKDASGSTDMNWWCGNGGAIDFTVQEHAQWYVDRLRKLLSDSGMDSFKFDAGETSYLPGNPQLSGDINLVPNIYVKKYAEAVNAFSGFAEVRVGRGTQDLPLALRMLDKDSRWGLDNGLQSVVTTLFQMNMAGYPFVLPDMIGGNQYGDPITKELFIRWLQASTFMPVLQFSVLPWDFDSETVEISRKFLDLHASYAQAISDAADKASRDGTPINTPIWWIAPDDQDALKCRDEYLFAETVLVAPVLEEGKTERDIYLPQGSWFHEEQGQIQGPVWLRNFPAPLGTLPYFVKTN